MSDEQHDDVVFSLADAVHHVRILANKSGDPRDLEVAELLEQDLRDSRHSRHLASHRTILTALHAARMARAAFDRRDTDVAAQWVDAAIEGLATYVRATP